MARIHFIGGEKGGVGKSLTSRLLAQYCIDNQIQFVGFDGDASHRSFSRFYQEFAAPVTLDDYASLDTIVETAEADPSRDIIVDLAAQSSSRLDRWLAETDIIGLLTEMGYTLYFWHLLDDGADAVKLLDRTLRDYGNSPVKIIAVKNLGRGDNFAVFDQSDTCQKALAMGVRIITLGRLHPQVTQKIDFADLSFWAAAQNRDALSLTERQRVKVWLGNAYQQLDELFRPMREIYQ
jgi:hypothetical protein